MRALPFLLIVCFSPFVSNSQTNPNWKSGRIANYSDEDYLNIDLVVSGNSISFVNLPETRKAIYAIVTNQEGEIVKQKRVSISDNEVLLKMPRKSLYFATLVCRSKNKRTFLVKSNN